MSLINQGPSIMVAHNDEEAINLINSMDENNNFTTIGDALAWVNTQEDIYAQGRDWDQIVTDNLTFYIDADDNVSYNGSGNYWYDLINRYGCAISGPSYSTNGYFSFEGQGERDGDPPGDYIILGQANMTTSPSTKPNGVTYQWWMRFTGEQTYGHSILMASGTINHLEWRGSLSNGYWRTEATQQNGYSFGAGNTYGGSSVNEWFNIAIVFANGEEGRPVRWYHNGILFHTGSMTNGTNPNTEYFSPIYFGRATGSSAYLYAQSFKGDLATFQIYDTALTTEQILQNYNATEYRFI